MMSAYIYILVIY